MACTTELLIVAALVGLAYYLILNSRTAWFYFRWTVFIVGSTFFGSVFIPIMLFRPRHHANALLPAWGARQISRFLGITWKVRGRENLVKDCGALVLLNHQSSLDLLCLAELWPIVERCSVISKKEIFYSGPFGLACWLWGTIFIDRLNGEKAQSTINSTAKHIRDKKTRLLMFPEGTRHGGTNLLPFKKGAFHLAISSQTPIQPVVVSRYYFSDVSSKKLESGTVLVDILPPIETQGLTKDDLSSLLERTYKIMETEYQRINIEVTNTYGNQNNPFKQN